MRQIILTHIFHYPIAINTIASITANSPIRMHFLQVDILFNIISCSFLVNFLLFFLIKILSNATGWRLFCEIVCHTFSELTFFLILAIANILDIE